MNKGGTNSACLDPVRAPRQGARVAHRWPRVRADVAAFAPRQVQAADELQVEGVAAVQHGEADDVGLTVHHLVQAQQREVLRKRRRKRRLKQRGSTAGGLI